MKKLARILSLALAVMLALGGVAFADAATEEDLGCDPSSTFRRGPD